MDNKNSNPFGQITISEQAIESAAINAALSCYGVVAVVNQPSKTQILDEFFKVDPKPGALAVKRSSGWHLSLYLEVMYGLKLTEIISTVQDQVKYMLEKTFDVKFKAVNIFIVSVVER